MLRVFLLFFCYLFVQSDTEPVLSWNASYKLSWEDFKGEPKNLGSAVAVTASGITFGFSVRHSNERVVSFDSEVHAHFYPEQSWYDAKRATPHILGHEQLHFDITELHARKFRQRIAQLEVSNAVRKELKAVHRAINRELSEMQDAYDNETDYSRQVEAQILWERYIKKELEKLDEFKSVN